MSEIMETLGSRLRGRRLGFWWVPSIERYVRISDCTLDGATFRVEVTTPDAFPKTASDALFRCWWEGKDRAALSADLGKVVRRRLGDKCGEFLIDDDGRKPNQ